MIAYTTVGTNDWTAASRFYDELFEVVGVKSLYETDRFKSYGRAKGQPFFAICKPYDGESATVGNGTMITIGCETEAQVQAMHAKTCELGGSCEGLPGDRADGVVYMAYARDLDGNKLAFCSWP